MRVLELFAGNSIVVDVLMGIFRNMFLENDTKGQLSSLWINIKIIIDIN